MRIGKGAIALAGALLVTAGCVGMMPSKVPRGAVFVEVKNTNVLDADVYLLSGGQTHRLGLVTTNRLERFRIEPRLVAPPGYLRVAADLLASNASFVSEELVLEPGEVVQLVVQPNIQSSYIRRR